MKQLNGFFRGFDIEKSKSWLFKFDPETTMQRYEIMVWQHQILSMISEDQFIKDFDKNSINQKY